MTIMCGKREMLAHAINNIEKNYNDQLKMDEFASRAYLSSH